MKIIHRGSREKPCKTYKFTCGSCKSELSCKDYELRPFGFKNTVGDPNPGFVFMCPVCNCQRVVRKRDLEMTVGIRERVDKILTDAVRRIERIDAKGGIQNV